MEDLSGDDIVCLSKRLRCAVSFVRLFFEQVVGHVCGSPAAVTHGEDHGCSSPDDVTAGKDVCA